MRQKAFTFTVLLMLSTIASIAGDWFPIVASPSTEAEQLALVDLQCYLAQVTSEQPEIVSIERWKAQARPGLFIGRPADNPFIKSMKLERELASAGEQGYVLARRVKDGKPVNIAAANTPAGTVNAVYGLLSELNYGFFLGSESIPSSLPDTFTTDTIVRTPALRVRGVLPWYNFFNSPTTWEPEDHRALVDQLIRSGANFVGFHSYDAEPFAAYTDADGKTTMGERLLNTAASTWSTRPIPTKEFAGGTDKFFDRPYFGADSTLTSTTRELAIRREKVILRDALNYAKRRGLQTCLGFEISHDPTDPAEQKSFTRRLQQLVEFYPMLDYVWLWQPETQGVQGYGDYRQHMLPGKLAPNSKLPELGDKHRQVFQRIVERSTGERPFLQETTAGKAARAMEGARLQTYTKLALDVLQKSAARPRLVISGWGGDDRLLSAEYYDGLDKLLPKSVAFASLDFIIPRPRVDRAYHDLPADRERWPIPWLEYDGDEWHPQPVVHVYEGMMRDLLKSRSQGVLGIHWRTRDVEENFGYMMAAAWNPQITATDYFRDLARRCYSPGIATDMAEIHQQLDRMGYRWVGGSGQVECGAFAWGPGTDEKAAQLLAIQERCKSLLPQAGNGAERVQWLIRCMDWNLTYLQAERDAVRAADLLNRTTIETTSAQELATEALAILTSNSLDDALQAYARRITTRGEYGVLATINSKAVPAWRDLAKRARELSHGTATTPSAPKNPWATDPQIVLPRLHTTAFAGQPLTFKLLVLGDKPAFVHFRTVGTSDWKTAPLTHRSGAVHEYTIPAAAMQSPGIQVGFSFSELPSAPMSFGPKAITVLPISVPHS